MSLPILNTFIPLIIAGLYTIVLVAVLVRSHQSPRQQRPFLLLLVAAIFWEFALYFEPALPLPTLPVSLLALNAALLFVTTAVYLEWSVGRVWGFVLLLLLAAAFVTDPLLPLLGLRVELSFPRLPTVGTAVAFAAWAIFQAVALFKTWRAYHQTSFPWHANRLLYWFIALNMLFMGELLILTELPVIAAIGQFVRFVAITSLAYGVASYRIFDVRARSQRALAFLIINTISALPLIAAILLVQQFDELNRVQNGILVAIVVTVSFFLYQPFRNQVAKITYRYLIGESLNTNQVVRNYSQAISRTLDVQQLSLLIVGTLSELLETNRGALMLAAQDENGDHLIDPIPAMGKISRQQFRLSAENVFIETLLQLRQPLLQYDLDYSPEFRVLDAATRQWLKEQMMEAYVPIISGAALVGLIAIGPKNSGVPYQPSELDLVQILADQTVVALQNARLYSELGNQNEQIRHLNRDLVEQNERLEIMDRVKSDFITIASHELRTPLTQVKGYTDILSAMNEENALTREQTREIVGHVNRATLQLESLITAMLDASQLDVDGMQLTFVKTQLDTILRLATEPLLQAMRERQITFKVNGIDKIPSLYADFKRLVQAFHNIIGNAVKYTPDYGAITIDAKLVPSHNEEQFLELVISDTGIGIDPRFHDLIFEKFFRIGDPQLHSTGSTKFKGAGPGLGLPIAKGVIEAHGGRIWVESDGEDEDRLPGSRFHIVLPMKPRGMTMEEVSASPSRPAYLMG